MKHLAVAARLAHRLLVPVDRPLVDDRAEPVLADERVADDDRLGLLDQQPHELVVDRPLDVDPRVGRALLAAEPERGAHDPLGRLVEVGRARHDGRVLAAHLDDARPRPRLAERVEQLHPDLVRAGEDDAVDAGVVLERLADRLARAHDEVDDALRDARIDVRLEHDLRPTAATPTTA